MKKVISVFLACVMAFSFFALAASAYKVLTVTCDAPVVGEALASTNTVTVSDSGSEDAVNFVVYWYAFDKDETINLKTRKFNDDTMTSGTYKEGYQYVMGLYFATDVKGYKAPEKVTVNGNVMTKNDNENVYYYNFGEPAAAENTNFITSFVNAIKNVFKTLINIVVNLISTLTNVSTTTTTTDTTTTTTAA